MKGLSFNGGNEKIFFIILVILACDFCFVFTFCDFWKSAPATRPQIISDLNQEDKYPLQIFPLS